jgi:uncharacterized protein YegL
MPSTKSPHPHSERRFPVFLRVDRAGDVQEAPLAALEQGLENFTAEAKGETLVAGRVRAAAARSGAMCTRPDDRRACGPRLAGGAKDDWRPLVFIVLAGPPTDDRQQDRNEILNRQRVRKVEARQMIAIGCGSEIDCDMLATICN